MTFAAELDDVRPQLRRGYASNLVTYWPKVDGANALVTAASATFYSPAGASIASPAVTNDEVDGVSRLRVTLDAGSLALGEDYRVDFAFTHGGLAHVRTLRVDVLTQPWSPADELSLNDLQDVWPDIVSMLARQAKAQQEDRTAVQQATLLYVRAWALVRGRLRKLVESAYSGSSFPSLLVSREELRPIMVAETIALAWMADNNLGKAAEWREYAAKCFAELPALRFDVSQDQVPDVELRGWASVAIGRSW